MNKNGKMRFYQDAKYWMTGEQASDNSSLVLVIEAHRGIFIQTFSVNLIFLTGLLWEEIEGSNAMYTTKCPNEIGILKIKNNKTCSPRDWT